MKRLFVVLLLLCSFASASQKMTIVGEVVGRQVVSPSTGRWSSYSEGIIADSLTVIGFEHVNGEPQNLTFCGTEVRFRLFSMYQLELELVRDQINQSCWKVISAKRIKK
jgi:hypothetical protein